MSACAPNRKIQELADVAVDGFGDLILGNRAHDLLDDLAVLKNEQRRDTSNVITASGVHRFVDVKLGDLKLASVVIGDLGDGRCKHVTRAAPFRPEIDQHWLSAARGEDFRFEVAVVDGEDIVCHVVYFQQVTDVLGTRLTPCLLIRCCNR